MIAENKLVDMEPVDINDRLSNIQTIIHKALTNLGYPDEVFELLKDPIRMLTVKIPIRLDDGTISIYTAYRAQHNDAVGPTKGGVRFHPLVTERELKASSIVMSLICGIVNLPFGGAKGGVVCDPRDMTFRELEKLSRGYVRAISEMIGPMKDILSSDAFTNSQIIAWMMDEYSKINIRQSSAFMTGKPDVLGGTQGRESAIASGIYICIREAAKRKGIQIAGARVIIQGFGSTGSVLSKLLHDLGARIVGISDAYAALYDPNGLDIDYLLDRRDSFGTVTKLFNHTITNEELLELECDILIPSAMENQINDQNANKVKANIIVEATSASTTKEATEILSKKNILIVPDVLSSAGGVTVSYFEWVQNQQGYYWRKEEVEGKLEEVMCKAFEDVYQMSESRRVDMRLAAYMVGVRKMAEASRFRGWI